MSAAENATGPHGTPSGTGSPAHDARSIDDHCQQIYHDAQALAAAVQDAARDWDRYLTEQVEERPYATLGVAVGVGYVLGGGLRSRLTAVLLNAATRLAMAVAAREFAARLSPRASESAQTKSS